MTYAKGLLPRPFCGSERTKEYVAGGYDYVQCQNCASCGPDHKNGLHWNRRALTAQPEAERKLDKPAMVGNTVFRERVSERLVVEAAQRRYEYHQSGQLTAQPESEPVAFGLRNPDPGKGTPYLIDIDFVPFDDDDRNVPLVPKSSAPPVAAGMMRAALEKILKKNSRGYTYNRDECFNIATNALDSAAAAEPQGVVVPVEPIMGQWDDFCKESGVSVPFEAFIRGYKAMLRASGEPK